MLKRAVRYGYLDFSTAERRKAMCDAEVRINRRTAPALYRGVVAVTRERDGSLAIGGSGAPVDWLIDMVRFDQDGLLDRLAARGALELDPGRPTRERVTTEKALQDASAVLDDRLKDGRDLARGQ